MEFDALISFYLQRLREHLHDFAIDDLVLEAVWEVSTDLPSKCHSGRLSLYLRGST